MFEYEGGQYTIQDLKAQADKRSMDFEEFMQKMYSKGMTQAKDTSEGQDLNLDVSSQQPFEQEDDGFDDDMSIAQGVENWAKNFIPNRKANLFQIKESIGGYINLMGGPDAAAWFLGEDVDSKGQAVMIDPDNGLKVGFDNSAYDRDGHDAFENRRYYELNKRK